MARGEEDEGDWEEAEVPLFLRIGTTLAQPSSHSGMHGTVYEAVQPLRQDGAEEERN